MEMESSPSMTSRVEGVHQRCLISETGRVKHGDRCWRSRSVPLSNKPARKSEFTRGAYRPTEQHTGIPCETVRQTDAPVAAVERYPEHAMIATQQDALTMIKNLDAWPEVDRPVRVLDHLSVLAPQRPLTGAGAG